MTMQSFGLVAPTSTRLKENPGVDEMEGTAEGPLWDDKKKNLHSAPRMVRE